MINAARGRRRAVLLRSRQSNGTKNIKMETRESRSRAGIPDIEVRYANDLLPAIESDVDTIAIVRNRNSVSCFRLSEKTALLDVRSKIILVPRP